MEAIIKRIYYSDYDQSGTLFQMSTSYQLLFANKNQVVDPESKFRFYKKRQISKEPQSQWMYHIFKESMCSRIIASNLLGVVYVAFSIMYY